MYEYGQGPSYLSERFNVLNVNYDLRGGGSRLKLPPFNLECLHKSFSYIYARLWNGIPVKVREAKDLPSFKRALRANVGQQIFVTFTQSVYSIFVMMVFMNCIDKFYLVNSLRIFFCIFSSIHVTTSLRLLGVLHSFKNIYIPLAQERDFFFLFILDFVIS